MSTYETPCYIDEALDPASLNWLDPVRDHLRFIPAREMGSTSSPVLHLTADGPRLVCDRLGRPLDLGAPPARGHGHLLRKALGRNAQLKVLDACAGFGNDTLWLPGVAELVLIEADPSTWVMLAERNSRLARPAELHFGDALTVMAAWSPGRFNAVYLDPMFDTRRKTALPNRSMQFLRSLERTSVSVEALLAAARSLDPERIVLKRRLKDPVLERPSVQIAGQKVRFDVYVS